MSGVFIHQKTPPNPQQVEEWQQYKREPLEKFAKVCRTMAGRSLSPCTCVCVCGVCVCVQLKGVEIERREKKDSIMQKLCAHYEKQRKNQRHQQGPAAAHDEEEGGEGDELEEEE